MSVCLGINQGVTNRNRCTQRLVILILAYIDLLMNPHRTSKNYVIVTYFTGQNRPPKTVDANRHFQAS